MPHLVLFAPCEKLLRDLDDGDVSIVGLLDTMTVTVPPGESIPERTEILFTWVVYTQWMKAEHEQGQVFEQRVELETPTGEIALDNTAQLFPNGPLHRHAVKGTRFPVAPVGQYYLHLSVRETTSGQDWQRLAMFPIRVEHQPQVEINASDRDR